ncbi:MAG: DUF2975 domain-containing protein [Colwellia sp.]|nr:DUF2975 domain-containing protein [Colwellia sp.]
MLQDDRIRKISKIVRALVALFIITQVGVYALLVISAENQDGIYQLSEHSTYFSSAVNIDFSGSWGNIAQALTDEGFNALLILGSAELVPSLLIYLSLFKLFGLYQRGLVFTAENIQCIKNVGTVLLGWLVLKLFYPLLVSLALRLSGASDTLSIYMSVGSDELRYLLIGLVIYVIAWVMSEATSLHQEQELVI